MLAGWGEVTLPHCGVLCALGDRTWPGGRESGLGPHSGAGGLGWAAGRSTALSPCRCVDWTSSTRTSGLLRCARGHSRSPSRPHGGWRRTRHDTRSVCLGVPGESPPHRTGFRGAPRDRPQPRRPGPRSEAPPPGVSASPPACPSVRLPRCLPSSGQTQPVPGGPHGPARLLCAPACHVYK